jgi:hypothetical protein
MHACLQIRPEQINSLVAATHILEPFVTTLTDKCISNSEIQQAVFSTNHSNRLLKYQKQKYCHQGRDKITMFQITMIFI